MRRLLATLLFAGTAGCDAAGPTAVAPAVEEPNRVFIFENVEIEQRGDGRTVWSGTAKRADGDLDDLDVRDVELTVVTGNPNARQYLMRSPSGHLAPKTGEATFAQVRVTDEHGGRIDAGKARYVEKQARIVADGPVLFSSQGLEAHATSGTMNLREGTVEIVGPIIGRFVAPRE